MNGIEFVHVNIGQVAQPYQIFKNSIMEYINFNTKLKENLQILLATRINPSLQGIT